MTRTGELADHVAAKTAGQGRIDVQLSRSQTIFRFLGAIVLLYLFLVSVAAMGVSFKMFGKGFARALIQETSNPFVGLFVGLLATSIVQSSSTVTSMIVAFVASGTLSVQTATPVVMGANIGTTVTGMLVAFIHVGSKQEFEKAYAAATVHDIFNVLSVLVLLPLELATGFLHKSAAYVTQFLVGSSTDLSFHGPLARFVKPVAHGGGHMLAFLGKPWDGVTLLIASVAVLIFSLYMLTRLMKTLVLNKAQSHLNKALESVPAVGLLVGIAVTAIIQSSSVTTSLMVPLAAAGVLTIEQVFPVALGANVGTTVTALLASLAGNAAGMTIALVHLLFNISGILVFYPIGFMRRIPIRLAETMGRLGAKSAIYAVIYVVGLFFVLPGTAIFVWRMMH
ncbi:MAG: Na/Pi cotransporter family protein [Deltaproteobacteria bacterium]|nr:Na/Pi cotransporter family protein [Deltaproteobacteria bacterium]